MTAAETKRGCLPETTPLQFGLLVENPLRLCERTLESALRSTVIPKPLTKRRNSDLFQRKQEGLRSRGGTRRERNLANRTHSSGEVGESDRLREKVCDAQPAQLFNFFGTGRA